MRLRGQVFMLNSAHVFSRAWVQDSQTSYTGIQEEGEKEKDGEREPDGRHIIFF